jgi:hypothetical protein
MDDQLKMGELKRYLFLFYFFSLGVFHSGKQPVIS